MEAMDDSIARFLEGLPTTCHGWVSTMTTCAKTNVRVHANDLVEWDHPHIHVRVPGVRKNRQSSFRSFYNAVSCSFFMDKVQVVIKVFFTNGTIHLTGSKTCHHAKQCMEYFVKELGEWMRSDFQVDLSSFCVQLANVIVTIPKLKEDRISLSMLKDMLHNSYECHYHPDIYVGLKVRVPITNMRKVTLLCFSSACFIFTGLKKPEDMGAVDTCLRVLEELAPKTKLPKET